MANEPGRSETSTAAHAAGDALLVVGPHDALDDALPHLAALVAALPGWRVRQLVASSADAPTRRRARRELQAHIAQPSAARLVVFVGALTRTLEGASLACVPEADGFREDAALPLDWIGAQLRRSPAPTVFVLSAEGEPAAQDRWGAALDASQHDHLVVVHAGPAARLLAALGRAIAARDELTTRALGDAIAALVPSAEVRHAAISAVLRRAPRAASADPLIGAHLPGQLRIDAELGRGGFAVVYRAHQELVGRDVAVKVLRDALAPDAERRFLQEAQLVAALDHPHIVRVLHADRTAGGQLFLAMELLVGDTLQHRLRAPLAVDHALAIAAQLLAAVATAHARGVLHADIKPSNIFLDQRAGERVVLLDFGLSQLRTAATTSGGTPAYMSPERLRDGRADEAGDVYACTLVVVAMLTGARDAPRALDAIHDGPLRDVLCRALDDDPAARFPSADAFAAALRRAHAHPTRAPFRPAPFDAVEHAAFFGREREIQTLLDQLLSRRAVIYVAPSGTGKTSLLRAGLVPRLAQLDARAVYVECLPGVPLALAEAIAPGATAIADAIAAHAHRDPRRLVLIIDQLEVALVGTGPRTLVEDLELAAWPRDAAISVVLSVREEFLARLVERTQRIDSAIPILRLGPLTLAAAQTALERTLAVHDLTLEPALLTALMEDLSSAAARSAIELSWSAGPAIYPPHLQLVGAVLYETAPAGAAELTLAQYRQLGGLDKIIAEHLHHVLEGELPPAHTAIARDLLLALVTDHQTRTTRSEPELLAIACSGPSAQRAAVRTPRTTDAVRSVLAYLRERGILVALPPATGDDDLRWELAHDSLIQRIDAWLTSTDLARRRALELVRYHLRRSDARVQSLLQRADLRELDAHLDRADLAALDDEWALSGTHARPASALVAASRRTLRRVRLTLALTLFAVAASIAALVHRWQDERANHLRETRLRDRDVGHFVLELTAFDWDPATHAARDASAGLQLDWELRRALDDESPGALVTGDDLQRYRLPLPGALRSDAVATRGGPAILIVHRRQRDGEDVFCSDIQISLRSLPGYRAESAAPVTTPHIAVRVPSCQATRADLIEVPPGPFIAGGQGEPRTPYDDDQLPREAVVDLPRYWIDRTEVSLGAMRTFIAMRALHGITEPPSPDQSQRYANSDGLPARAITWREARAYCRYLGKDLPTMDQWDKALRGGITVDGSANPCPRRNFAWCGAMQPGWTNVRSPQRAAPSPVGSYARDRSPYGVLDLVGNVQEWTRSPALDYYQFPASLSTAERWRRQTQAGAMVITRGCNWGDIECADQPLAMMPIPNARLGDQRWFTLGLRCALTPGDAVK